MSNSAHFVTLTNTGTKPVVLIPPKRKPAHGEVQLRERIKLEPGKPSHPLPFDLVTHAYNWKRLEGAHRLDVQDVTFAPTYVRIENVTDRPVELELRLPGKLHRVVLEPGETSSPLYRARLSNLSTVAGSVSIEPAEYIGPPMSSEGSGSFGSETVYSCYECGGPIVFRMNGSRHPVHI